MKADITTETILRQIEQECETALLNYHQLTTKEKRPAKANDVLINSYRESVNNILKLSNALQTLIIQI